LQPGETYAAGISLPDLRNNFSWPSRPADYQLEAVFLYDDLNGFPEADQHYVARSRPVAIRLVALEGGGRAGWFLRPGSP
jgi:hypothetical protein